ncbi:YicC/YloC family endoribonuclease [Sneathiella chinensis]|nr:YicC/YloC family endoribonuclease [Sneathiella chinensis]
MTGFARAKGEFEDYSWLWEIKSVNGRGLEIRCRTPGGLDRVEEIARKRLKARFNRGSINLQLQLSRSSARAPYVINRDFLEELIDLANDYVHDGKAKPARIDGLLGLKGVIDQGEREAADDDEQKALEQALTDSLGQLLDNFEAARAEEGALLLPVLTTQVDEIEALTLRAAGSASLRPEKVRGRMQEQMALLLGGENALDANRLEQELALLATKADVSEELDRLKSHVTAARDILSRTGTDPVGRRLDFLCQEFNREANTLCSKANDKELTQIGLDLKVVIDRLREQVQNIE